MQDKTFGGIKDLKNTERERDLHRFYPSGIFSWPPQVWSLRSVCPAETSHSMGPPLLRPRGWKTRDLKLTWKLTHSLKFYLSPEFHIKLIKNDEGKPSLNQLSKALIFFSNVQFNNHTAQESFVYIKTWNLRNTFILRKTTSEKS